jgi:hypothetical protein
MNTLTEDMRERVSDGLSAIRSKMSQSTWFDQNEAQTEFVMDLLQEVDRKARVDEINKFMDVNVSTLTDTQGTYIARRYQEFQSPRKESTK